jgi:hypothetical protein
VIEALFSEQSVSTTSAKRDSGCVAICKFNEEDPFKYAEQTVDS